MAVLRGNRIVRGKIGDTGHRQQYVKEGNGYRKRTVAYQLPVSVTVSDSVASTSQRNKFALIQALSSALTAVGFTRNLYRSGIGIGGYQAFIRDNIRAVVGASGNWFIDFAQVRLSIGDFKNEIKSSQADVAWLKDESGIDPNCQTSMALCWSHNANQHPDALDYQLYLVGVKVKEDGSLDDIITHQPLVNMSQCNCQTLLPLCGCCKTYWYGMFVNPINGKFSSSTYLGADTIIDQLPEYSTDCCCATCDEVAVTAKVTAPSELPLTCCGEEEFNPNRSFITFTGENNVVAPFGAAPFVLVPDETVTLAYDDSIANIVFVTPSNPSRLQKMGYSFDGVTYVDITETGEIPGDIALDAATAAGGTVVITIKTLYAPYGTEYTNAFNFAHPGIITPV